MKNKACTEAIKTLSTELKAMASSDITQLRMALAQVDATAVMCINNMRNTPTKK